MAGIFNPVPPNANVSLSGLRHSPALLPLGTVNVSAAPVSLTYREVT
jgi:hypothetical protein